MPPKSNRPSSPVSNERDWLRWSVAVISTTQRATAWPPRASTTLPPMCHDWVGEAVEEPGCCAAAGLEWNHSSSASISVAEWDNAVGLQQKQYIYSSPVTIFSWTSDLP